jgi:hypothetical protein
VSHQGLNGIGMMITIIGAWLVSSVPTMLVDGITLLAYGLAIQYLAVRPLIKAESL